MPEHPLSDAVNRNIAAVRDLAAQVRRGRSRIDRVTDAISGFAGSPRFLAAQVAVIGGVDRHQRRARPRARFDPFPFEFLNFVLAVEAIVLSTVVLMAQNRQGRESAEQAELHLQIGLLAEQETTKMLEMLRDIHTKIGLGTAAKDPELREMIQTTQVELIADELQRSRTDEAPSSEPGPA